MQIDLNCDMGEGPGSGLIGHDVEIMPHISSANIACGFHAGDPLAIEKTICLAIKHGVGVGAHPGYPDPEGFGRRHMDMEPDALSASVKYQVGAVKGMAESMGTRLGHVKLHGALYNAAAADPILAGRMVAAIRSVSPELIFVGLPNTPMQHAALKAGMAFAAEVFADRAYDDSGRLLPRHVPDAVLHDAEEMMNRVISMVTRGEVVSHGGRIIAVRPDTVCIHGDNPAAPEFVRMLRKAFARVGIEVKPMKAW